jgi:hypothetical protein
MILSRERLNKFSLPPLGPARVRCFMLRNPPLLSAIYTEAQRKSENLHQSRPRQLIVSAIAFAFGADYCADEFQTSRGQHPEERIINRLS